MTIEEAFIQYKEIYQIANIGKELEEIINVDELLKTPLAINVDSGLAYDGAIIYHSIAMWFYAKKLHPVYSTIYNVDLSSLAKIIILQPLGNVGMFVSNDNEWEVNKLGRKYKFSEKSVCLKKGDYSKILCQDVGIQLSLNEYEAMGVLDKSHEDYEKSLPFLGHLSIMFKMCNDLAIYYAREKYKKQKK